MNTCRPHTSVPNMTADDDVEVSIQVALVAVLVIQ